MGFWNVAGIRGKDKKFWEKIKGCGRFDGNLVRAKRLGKEKRPR